MTEELSNRVVRKAGESLRADLATKEQLDTISEFRASHTPLMRLLVNTIARKLPKPLFIARRLKRLSSIEAKLKRFPTMCLDRMQDIGGVRAVFKDSKEVQSFANNLKSFYSKHRGALEIVKENDYIAKPKQDGYRSLHLVFKYRGKNPKIEGYHIELQLRDLLQHYWASAVEILALRSTSNIKAGYGDEHFKRFFWLCAELFSGHSEHKEEIKSLDKEHNILFLLRGLNVLANKLEQEGSSESLYLLVLEPKKGVLKLTSFSQSEQALAYMMYQSMETSSSVQSVLVSIDSVKKLKKAYPNYVLDAKKLIK